MNIFIMMTFGLIINTILIKYLLIYHIESNLRLYSNNSFYFLCISIFHFYSLFFSLKLKNKNNIFIPSKKYKPPDFIIVSNVAHTAILIVGQIIDILFIIGLHYKGTFFSKRQAP